MGRFTHLVKRNPTNIDGSLAQQHDLFVALGTIATSLLEAEAALDAYLPARHRYNSWHYREALIASRAALTRRDISPSARALIIGQLADAPVEVLQSLPTPSPKVEMSNDFFQTSEELHAAMMVQVRGFVTSLGRAGRVLESFSKLEGLPAAVRDEALGLDRVIPALRGIRNSAEHIEDRTQGIGPSGRLIPGLGGGFHFEGLEGDTYKVLLADGTTGTIEVSAATLERAYTAIFPFWDSLVQGSEPVG